MVGRIIGLAGIVVAAVSAIAAIAARRRLRRLRGDWEIRAAQVAPIARQGGLSEEELSRLLLDPSDWVIIFTGGVHKAGIFRNLDLCPGHQCYAVAINRIPLAGMPNVAQIGGLLVYPADPPAPDRCAGTCVHHKTHRWQGFYIVVNVKTGALFLDCMSFAQYRCILPNDPMREQPPVEGPPGPEA